MQIIYQINAHLDRREPCCVLDAVQGESGRAVTVSLYEKDQPWTIPAEARVLIRYGRPDGCGGIYDTLGNGSKACTWSDHSVTAILTPQALAVAGLVSFQLAIVTQQQELATFSFLVRVESDPSKETAAAEDLVCLLPELVASADRAEAAANRAEEATKYLDDAVIAANSAADAAAASAQTADSAARQAQEASRHLDDAVIAANSAASLAEAAKTEAFASRSGAENAKTAATAASETAEAAAIRAEQAAQQAAGQVAKTTLFEGTPSPLGEVILSGSICQFDLVLFHLVKSDGQHLDLVVHGTALPSDERFFVALPPYGINGSISEPFLIVTYNGCKLQSYEITGAPYTLTSVVGLKFNLFEA